MEYVAFPMAVLGFIFALQALDETKKLRKEVATLKASKNKKDNKEK